MCGSRLTEYSNDPGSQSTALNCSSVSTFVSHVIVIFLFSAEIDEEEEMYAQSEV